jgi:DNA-binding LytR/AlgR family response regulator
LALHGIAANGYQDKTPGRSSQRDPDAGSVSEGLMLNIMIVEDQTPELKRCGSLIREIFPDCKLYFAKDGNTALQIISRVKIDAGFIDKELPDIDGFDLVSIIRKYEPYSATPIIFVTGNDADSFELRKKYHHYEYICKPYTKEHFIQVAAPFLRGIAGSKRLTISEEIERERIITFNFMGALHTVRLTDILYAEASRHALTLYTGLKKYPNVQMELAALIKLVDSPSFVRCHKSYAVNISKIASIRLLSRKTWDIYFNERGTIRCPLSAYYKEKIRKICPLDIFSF